MKCDITKNGVLVIQPETELEEYAFGKWIDDNLSDESGLSTSNLIFKRRTKANDVLATFGIAE